LSDYQDPLYSNPSNSAQLPVPFIDTVVQAIDATKYILSGLSGNSQRDYIMGTAFGLYNQDSANPILTDWAQNNFTNTPHIELVFGQNFNGAFAKENNTIYLSQEFVAANQDNVGAVTGVLVEEVGHSLDSQINVQDADGDEGDIFSRLLRGQSISAGELVSLKAEDDTATININGKDTAVEMSKVAMELFNNRIYQSVRGTDNGIYNRSSVDGTTWTAWQNFGGATLSGPDLEVFNGRLYQSVRGTDNGIYNRSSVDGTTWTAWQNFGGATLADPELEVFNGKLFQAVQGTDNAIYTRYSSNGTNWNVWEERGGLTPADALSNPVTPPPIVTPPPSGLMTTSTNLTKLINGQLNGTYIDVDGAYGAQCWDLVAYATGINGSSSYWNANNWKAGENVMSNGNVAVGTAIATFLGPNGSYYSSSGNHTAIFAGYGSENGVAGFYVWDQNWNLSGNVAIKKHFVANNKSGTSDADNYYLIRV
jgi:hypothetical protein